MLGLRVYIITYGFHLWLVKPINKGLAALRASLAHCAIALHNPSVGLCQSRWEKVNRETLGMLCSSLSAFRLWLRARTWAQGWPLLTPQVCHSHSKHLPPAAGTLCAMTVDTWPLPPSRSYNIPVTHIPYTPTSRKLME